MVQKPIQNRGGYRSVVMKYFRPVFEWFIAGDDYRTAFIALADYLKKQVASELVDRQISNFVNGYYVRPQVSFQGFIEAVCRSRRRQVINDLDCGSKERVIAFETGLPYQRRRNMRLPIIEKLL
jgi:hypothetical protein